MEEDAILPMQCESHILETDVTSTDEKTKIYRNLVPCYVEDSLIATPTLEDHTKRLDEVFARIKSAGLNCKPSKCES